MKYFIDNPVSLNEVELPRYDLEVVDHKCIVFVNYFLTC